MADSKREIVELREQIAEIDRQILERLEARIRLSRDIHLHLEGEPTLSDSSEREFFQRLDAASTGLLSPQSLRAIFQQIRAEARAVEQPVRVAYVGPEGGFCHELGKNYFGASAALVECASPAEAFDEVVRGRAVFAVFPFESSTDGLVQPAITALAQTE